MEFHQKHTSISLNESILNCIDLHRFGFQGQEKDDEITGSTGSHYTAIFWEYDSRIGRRWNVDPVIKEYESPYVAFANNPIFLIDPFGSDSAEYDAPDKSTVIISSYSNVEKFESDMVIGQKSGTEYEVMQGSVKSFVEAYSKIEYTAKFSPESGFVGYYDKKGNKYDYSKTLDYYYNEDPRRLLKSGVSERKHNYYRDIAKAGGCELSWFEDNILYTDVSRGLGRIGEGAMIVLITSSEIYSKATPSGVVIQMIENDPNLTEEEKVKRIKDVTTLYETKQLYDVNDRFKPH